MRYRISSPVRDFAGEVAGVAFFQGRAEADDAEHARALEYFRRKGYTVELVEPPSESGDTPPVPEADAEPKKTTTMTGRRGGATSKGDTP